MQKHIVAEAVIHHSELLLSGKNKQKAQYLFIHRYCSRFTHPGTWFSVSNCKHKKCTYFDKKRPIITDNSKK